MNEQKLISLIRFIQKLALIKCKKYGNKIGVNHLGRFSIYIFPGGNSPAIKVIDTKSGYYYRFCIKDDQNIICLKGSRRTNGDHIKLNEAPDIEKLVKIALYMRI